ncbi:MAG: alkaline phosphatase [Flavobacteriaceae bacterium]|nr:alkaline phosphatase [Flavobacteriaceae bacterium]
MRLSILLCLFCLLLMGCETNKLNVATANSVKKPKNIILLIADGTGLSQISSSLFFNDKPSNYEAFPFIGLIKTSASDNLITDSAAGATAFASGIKTYNGAIGVGADTMFVPTIVEQISENGMSTGVIATSSITHATPAAFYAHTESRRSYEKIAEYLVNSQIDFFAGGGLKFFNKREDKQDLLSILKNNGFVIDTTSLKTMNANKQGFLLAEDAMPKMLDGRGDFLTNATQLAINQLSQNKNGFFLMVEGSQVDWGGHSNESDYLISELIDFDDALGVALKFAETNGETLIIVTADHETGGFTLSADNGDYNKIKPTFSTKGHSATMVPVFAKGPGAELFSGIYENTEIYHKMMELLSK